MSDIKIFVSHRIDMDSEIIDNPLYVPVRCGAVYDKRENVTMLGDDTGDNISEKRSSYCELTVQYWAWKNVEADYYGLCHYRRYLSFSDKYFTVDYRNQVNQDYMTTESLKRYNLLSPDIISNSIKNNDVITSEYADVRKIATPTGFEDSVEKHWRGHDNILIDEENIDLLLNIIKQSYSEYFEDAIKYLSGWQYRGYNCFVMRKKLFFELCEFQFGALAQVEKQLDLKYCSQTKWRTCGFLGEILYGIFMFHLENNKKIKIKTLQLVYFENTEKEGSVLPAFLDNNVPIVLLSSDYYVPYLSVLIKSIIKFSSCCNNYDIIVFQKGISEKNQKILVLMCAEHKNFSLRFYDPKRHLAGISLFIASPSYAKEANYRILTPWILDRYDKAIVMDCDIVVQKDIASLFKENIDEYLAGAVKDSVFQGLLNGMNPEAKTEEYCKDEMPLKNAYNYVNTGVLLMNLVKFRRIYSEGEVINHDANHQYRIQEQDLLNVLLDGKVSFLDAKWNHFVETNIWVKQCLNYAPAEAQLQHDQAQKDPFVIHFANIPKPWQNPEMDFAEVFWSISRTSPFYEIMLARMGIHFSNEVASTHQTTFHAEPPLRLSLKQKIKMFSAHFLPYGSKSRAFLKKYYFKLRGWK